jgi:hypothetical protein
MHAVIDIVLFQLCIFLTKECVSVIHLAILVSINCNESIILHSYHLGFRQICTAIISSSTAINQGVSPIYKKNLP